MMGWLDKLLSFHRGELAVKTDWRALKAILEMALAEDTPDNQFDVKLRSAIMRYYGLLNYNARVMHQFQSIKNWIYSQRTIAEAAEFGADARIARRLLAYVTEKCRELDAPNR